eukprot:915893-Amphidinium_carterae.1
MNECVPHLENRYGASVLPELVSPLDEKYDLHPKVRALPGDVSRLIAESAVQNRVGIVDSVEIHCLMHIAARSPCKSPNGSYSQVEWQGCVPHLKSTPQASNPARLC